MKVQILADRSNVKPLPVVQNDSANSAVFLDPFGHDRDERDFLCRRDSSKNRGTPHGDVSEIVAARDAESVGNIYDFAIGKSNVGAETGSSQVERDVIFPPKMFLDQWPKVQVSENVSAVS